MKIKNIILLSFVMIISISCNGQKSDNLKLYIDEAKTFLNELEKNDFSGQAFVISNGKILLDQGYGLADRSKKIPNTENTVFDIGSLTKLYTKAAIIKLIEQDKLKLNDNLKSIFEQIPTDKEEITILQLLDMSSGFAEYLPDNIGDFDFLEKSDAIKIVFNKKLRFKPGTDQMYSNVGYNVLAMIIEEKSGMAYQKFLKDYIFPKEIAKHGFYRDKHWKEKNVAIGYDNMNYGEANSPFYWPELSWSLKGAGGIVTSAKGVSQWLDAIKKENILDKKHTKMFEELQIKSPTPRGTEALVRAGGTSYGFTSVIADYPIEGFTIVINSNTAKYNVPGSVFRNFTYLIINGKKMPPVVNEVRSNDNGRQNVSPKEVRLEEFLEVLKEGDLKSYIENNFTNEFIKDFGLNGHLEFLNTVRSKEGSFVLIKTIESRMGYLKSLVESEKTKEQMALILEFSTSPPFKILGLGLEPMENIEDKGKEKQPANLTYAEKLLYEFFIAMRGNENELKKFIKDNFEENFLNDHGGVEGHYNFLRNNFRKGLELISVLNADTNEVVAKARSIENGNILKVSLSTIGSNHKISIIGIIN